MWRRFLIAPASAGVIAGLVYLLTLAPDLTWANHGADGGELITAAFTLGIPHPPGYPTYVILGKLFLLWPFGTAAYRLNLFSAVCVATSVAISSQFSAMSSQQVGKGDAPVVAALCLAFAPLVWGQAVITEVYGLNLLLVAALVWALWTKRPSWLVGLFLGLSLTTHLTSWLLLPMVFVSQWLSTAKTPGSSASTSSLSENDRITGGSHGWNRHSRGRLVSVPSDRYLVTNEELPEETYLQKPDENLRKPVLEKKSAKTRQICAIHLLLRLFQPAVRVQFLQLLAGMGLGLTPLLLLPLLARGHSLVVWGDPTTLEGWWWLVSGRLYRPNLFAPSGDWLPWLGQWAGVLGQQFTWVGWGLVAAGVWLMGQKRAGEMPPFSRLNLLVLLGTAVLYFLVALVYRTPNALVYTLPGLLLLTPFLAAALHHLGRLAWLLPLAALLFNFQGQNLRGENWVRPLVYTVFVNAPPDALLETSGDRTTFSLWYMQQVEQQRADVIIVDANLLAFDWYRARLQARYPDLLGLEEDNVMAFRALNGQKRPYCLVTLVPDKTTPDTLSCLSPQQ